MKKTVIALLFVICFKAAWGEEVKIQKWDVALVNSHSTNLVKVCLYRDKTTAGLFSQGDWKASIDSNTQIDCEEGLNADLELRKLYLYYRVDGGGEYRCDANRQQSKYGCSSAFVVKAGAISRELIDDIIKEAGLIALLEEQIPKVQRAKEAAKRAAYLQAYEHATTLESIQQFEATYAGNDSDRLIAKLADKKASLELQKYRDRFASAKTSNDFSSFIVTYEGKDIENLIPEARRKLTASEKQEVAEKEAAQRQAEVARHQSELGKFERQIAWCKSQSAMAQKSINRENEIGTVSGYVNKDRLHQAGEIIVSCKDSITKNYAEYRQQGGSKPLVAIK
jgi:hypothetical protein